MSAFKTSKHDRTNKQATPLKKVHDEAERDRKRGDGDFRNRRIEEPALAIHTLLPEEEERERQEEAKAVGSTESGADGDDPGQGGASAAGEKADGPEKAQEAWALVAEEVRLRALGLLWGTRHKSANRKTADTLSLLV